MNKYRGLYTFDTDNHRYVPLVSANGIVDLLDTDDYEPTEPLIKDEKIRKALREWAEACGDDCYYIISDYQIKDGSGYMIEFCNQPFSKLEKQHYTITQLCGEEQE